MELAGKILQHKGAVTQTPFRSLKRISDHSKARFTKNGYQKFFNVCSRGFGQQPVNVKHSSAVSFKVDAGWSARA